MADHVARVGRYGGALALLGVGATHIQQYYDGLYSAIPTIGTLFALNFVSATIVGLALVAPLPPRLLAWLAVGGIGIAAGSIAGLLLSESVGLFGFTEYGYRPVVVLSLGLEAATLVLLGLFLAAGRTRHAAPLRA
jgi:hypothetical protein